MTTPEIELTTGFVLDARGRIVSTREPQASRGPLFTLIRSSTESVWAVHQEVPDALSEQITELARLEPPVRDLRAAPVYAAEIADVTELTTAGGGFAVSERKLDQPYLKDYDQLPGEGPLHWPQRFDLSNWGLFGAYVAGQRVGGAAVAFDTPGVDMLEDRRDLAVLWDIRVDPRARGRSVGSALFLAVERWARARACQTLKIETQNTNLPACRFYARQGCSLGKIQRSAYPELPDEVQMLWYKSLAAND